MTASQSIISTDPARADVVVVTALRDEHSALLAVETGALGAWTRHPIAGTALVVDRRSFRAADGGELHVAAVCAENVMGAAYAAAVAGPVVTVLRPRCVAMCGVLAGRRDDTEFGDVIFADQLLTHDTGKRTVAGLERAMRPHKLPFAWLRRANDFAADPGDALAWLDRPAWNREQQHAWLLDAFAHGLDPVKQRALVDECCAEYPAIVRELVAAGFVRPTAPHLTDAGRAHVDEQRFLEPSWPGLDYPRRGTTVRVGDIVSGSAVQADRAIWGELSQFARKALGIEMEGHATGTVADVHQVELAVVMKGVMDHADRGKDDRFKAFAARASAEGLLAFLRRHLPTEVRAGVDDLLTPGTIPLPADTARAAPSVLLTAQRTAVPWHDEGRTEVVEALDRWADDPTREVSVHLLHAEGGCGKTRLAIEWAQRRRVRGDVAGFLVPRPGERWLERLCERGRPLVAVVDYAESRPDLVELLERVAAYAHTPGNHRSLHVLLLARNDGDWWATLKTRSTALHDLLESVLPITLDHVPIEGPARARIFRETAARHAQLRGRAAPSEVPALDDERFGRVLYLHMAALAAVEGQPVEAATLMERTLRHEESFWQQHALEQLRAALDVPLARQLMAAATLRGGLRTKEEARAQLERLRGRTGGKAEDLLLATLRQIHAQGDAQPYLPALEPELLGEAMVVRVAAPPVSEQRVADDWIDGVFPNDDADALLVGFTVLGRASVTAPDAVRPWVTRMLAMGALSVRAPVAREAAMVVGRRSAFSILGSALAEALQTKGDAAQGAVLEPGGVPAHTGYPREVASWIDQVAYRTLGEGDGALAERALRASNQGNRLSALGQREEALTATREAVEIRRTLAGRNPDAFLPDLAGSLNNLGIRFSDVGQRQEALTAAREAVGHYRTIAGRNPDAFLPDLAMSLHNLGARLSVLGQREEALTAAREAVGHYRTIAGRDPDDFLPDLARSLSNLGNQLSDQGQPEEALTAAREAVEIHRTLVGRNPDAFLPDLAGSLNNLSTILSDLGQDEEALLSTHESTEILRKLAARIPDTFLQGLASNLSNLGNRLGAAGHREEALAATEEGASIYRALATRNPDLFLPDFAAALNSLSVRFSGLDRHTEALTAAREAAEVLRVLTARNPNAFAIHLATSLGNLGAILSNLGQREEALAATQAASTSYRRASAANPFRPGPALDTVPGREVVLLTLVGLAKSRCPAVLLGPRRSGKTSIFRSLEREFSAQGFAVRRLTLDGNELDTRDTLASRLAPDLAGHPSPAIALLERHIASQEIVFLLDEAVQLTKLPPADFAWLRAFGQDAGSIIYACSSWDWVQVLRHAGQEPGSSFGNDVSPLTLGPLSVRDAERFLSTTAPPDAPIDETLAKQVISLCGPWPFYLQVMGHALVEAFRVGDLSARRDLAALQDLYERSLLEGRREVLHGRFTELHDQVMELLLEQVEGTLPEIQKLPPADRVLLRDAGLCDSRGSWIDDIPFFAWIAREGRIVFEAIISSRSRRT